MTYISFMFSFFLGSFVPVLLTELIRIIQKNKIKHLDDIEKLEGRCDLLSANQNIQLEKVDKTHIDLQTKFHELSSNLYEKYNTLRTSFENIRKQEDMLHQKEELKTALEMVFYDTYVQEKKKKTDFPEENEKVRKILPLVNLSIDDKIDIGRSLVERNFNNTFPVYITNVNHINTFNQSPYIQSNNIYLRFTRSVLITTHNGFSALSTVTTCVYNITDNTHHTEANASICKLLCSVPSTDPVMEGKRTTERNNKIKLLEK